MKAILVQVDQRSTYLGGLWPLMILIAVLWSTVAYAYPSSLTTGITESRCPNWDAIKTNTSGRTISSPTLIENEEITGQLTINSAGVTVRCVKINANGALYGINCFTAGGCPNLLAEDVEVYNCLSSCVNLKGTSGNNAVMRRGYLHDGERDLAKSEGFTELYDSYLSDSYNCAVCTQDPDPHNDGLQVAQGTDITIQGNRIDGPLNAQTSAIIIKADQAVINRVRVINNQLSGGSFTLYVREGNSFPMPDNVVIAQNRFGRDALTTTAQFGHFSTDTVIGCMEWRENRLFRCGPEVTGPGGTSPQGTCAAPQ